MPARQQIPSSLAVFNKVAHQKLTAFPSTPVTRKGLPCGGPFCWVWVAGDGPFVRDEPQTPKRAALPFATNWVSDWND